MKMFSSFRPVALASVAAGLGASALAPGTARAQSIESYEQSGWFVRAGGVARFNIKTNLTQVSTPLSAGVYDNGFVLPDDGGSTSKTWNWGYTSGLQGNQLVLTRYDNLPTIGKNDVSTPNPLFGAELIGGFQYSPFLMGNKTAHFRIEIGYGYSSFSEGLNFTGFSDSSFFTADSYGTGGIVVPAAPYAGTSRGPGPLIDLNPTSHLVANSPSVTTFNGSLDTTFQDFRFGPALDIDLSQHFTVGFGFGWSSVFADSTLSYAQNVAFANPGIPPIPTVNASVHRQDWRDGFYGEVSLKYRFTDALALYFAGDVRHNNNLQYGNADFSVRVDLATTFAAKIGLSYQF